VRRDGATVHINYKVQFTGQPAARGRTKASARDDLGDADDDIEVLDVEDEEEQSSSKQSRSSRGCKHGSSSHDAREGGEGHTERRPGQWIYKNNHNVSQKPGKSHKRCLHSLPLCHAASSRFAHVVAASAWAAHGTVNEP